MKTILFVLALLTFVSVDAFAIPQRFNRDIKLPSQAILEHQTITTPIVATTNRVLSTNAGPTSADALVITSFTAQPDVPRNLTITPTGTTTDVESCVITVTGTNFSGATITEDFTFAANANTAQTGNKAFKTVSSVSFPADCESGGFAATWIIGVGTKLGLNHCVDKAGYLAFSVFDGAYETTRGTMAVHATAIESNTFIPNGTPDAAKNVEVFYVQNFRCQ
jgi:hypothetical protein